MRERLDIATEATPNRDVGPDIAIVGLAGRFPGARNVDEYWTNLRDGVESIQFLSDPQLLTAGVDPAVLNHPDYVKAAPILEDADRFDANLFGYSPREARLIDPQQRIFLECAWEALESAGYDAAKLRQPIGVFAGSALNTYLLFSGVLSQFDDEYILTLIGNDKDYLATRVAYKLNLTGPSVTVQTACSTSLVAVHLACQSLLNQECDVALAGGVSVKVPLGAGYFFRQHSIFSPDGHCRAFDAGAQGTIFGSGVGVVVLKRLDDSLSAGDTIRAVIKGTAINNDGSSKVEFTAPSVVSQAEAIVEAISNSGADPNTITYIEAHGTGTHIGDPIEISALTKAFRALTERRSFCAIGSVKTNIGHMDAAAGVAGLIKTVLALEHQAIPASLHFERPNPEIDLDNSPFYVNGHLRVWETVGFPRRAGVNSLGMGGTNAFVVLEEAPTLAPSGPSRPSQVITLSAKSATALDDVTTRLAEYLTLNPEVQLADVAFTLQVGRKDLEYRRTLVCQTTGEAALLLRALDSKRVITRHQKPTLRRLAFMFTGQGAQYVGMGHELYATEPVFREALDRCAEILAPLLSHDLRAVLYPPDPDRDQASVLLKQTFITQPALFSVEYALAELWRSWGVTPDAFIGHSVGEYVAACLAGVFSLEDALAVIATRGKLMQGVPRGAMLVVPLPEKQIQPLLGERLCLAAINGPSLCVVAGEMDAVDLVETELAKHNVATRRLRTSHAFHSAMMEPILEPLAEYLQGIELHPPTIPFISSVTGNWISTDDALDPGYWSRHLREPVRFADGLEEIFREPQRVLLEVGPGQSLAALARIHPDRIPDQLVLASLRTPDDRQPNVDVTLSTLGELWLSGVAIDWYAVHRHELRRRIPLPTYPFERERYWAEPAIAHETRNGNSGTQEPVERVSTGERSQWVAPPSEPAFASDATTEDRLIPIWRELFGVADVGVHDDFFELGGNSLLLVRALALIQDAFGVELSPLNMLESPTIARLASCIEFISAQDPQPAPEPEAVVGHSGLRG